MKFTIGSPNPRFAKPPPVIVKLAGGLARSTVLGVMPLTPGPDDAEGRRDGLRRAHGDVAGSGPRATAAPPRERGADRRCGGQGDDGARGVRRGQVEGQETPAGELVTVPLPSPALVTVSANDGSMKVAVTEVAALSVTVQVPVPVQPPPLHPLKVEPADRCGGQSDRRPIV